VAHQLTDETRRRSPVVIHAPTWVGRRARTPGHAGAFLWPAIWMLPTDNTYGTVWNVTLLHVKAMSSRTRLRLSTHCAGSWAASGEIDIMEYRGQEPSATLATVHHGGQWPDNQYTGIKFDLGPPHPPPFNMQRHTCTQARTHARTHARTDRDRDRERFGSKSAQPQKCFDTAAALNITDLSCGFHSCVTEPPRRACRTVQHAS
jgi:hypothetical protein